MERITQEELDEQLMKLVNNELSDWASESEGVDMLILDKDISGLSFGVLSGGIVPSIKIEGCDMSGCDISDENIMIEGFEIVDSIVDDVKLGGYFRFGSFVGLNFDNCDLHGFFQESYFTVCSFRNANMDGCDYTGSRFEDCVFDGADMSGTNINEAEWENCSFKNVDFSYAEADLADDVWRVVNCDFDGAIFDEAEIWGENLDALKGSVLDNANIRNDYA